MIYDRRFICRRKEKSMVKIFLINSGKFGRDYFVCEKYMISSNSNCVHFTEYETGTNYVIPLVNVAVIEERGEEWFDGIDAKNKSRK